MFDEREFPWYVACGDTIFRLRYLMYDKTEYKHDNKYGHHIRHSVVYYGGKLCKVDHNGICEHTVYKEITYWQWRKAVLGIPSAAKWVIHTDLDIVNPKISAEDHPIWRMGEYKRGAVVRDSRENVYYSVQDCNTANPAFSPLKWVKLKRAECFDDFNTNMILGVLREQVESFTLR